MFDIIAKLETEVVEWMSKVAKPTSESMVAIFNRKKAAYELSKQTMVRTGSIDTRRIAYHRTSEDIFKTRKSMPQGKNHGYVFLIDFSGSMANVIASVIRQAVIYSMFCKRLGVPYKVLGFTDTRSRMFNESHVTDVDGITGYNDIKMYEVFNNNSTIEDFIDGIMTMSILSTNYPYTSNEMHKLSYNLRTEIAMAGTPLHRSLILAGMECRKMQLSGVQNVNLLCITDGANTNIAMGSAEMYIHRNSNNSFSRMISPFTGTSFEFEYSPTVPNSNGMLYSAMTSCVVASCRILNEIGIRVSNIHIFDEQRSASKNYYKKVIVSCIKELFRSESRQSIDRMEAMAESLIQVDEKVWKFDGEFSGFNEFYYASNALFGKGVDYEFTFDDKDLSKMSASKIAKILESNANTKNGLMTLNNMIVNKICESFEH